MGLEFPIRVGLAAGLDKKAKHIDSLAALGFGFIEVGTVTPRPQPGNPGSAPVPHPRGLAPSSTAWVSTTMAWSDCSTMCARALSRHPRHQTSQELRHPIERAAEDYLYCLRKVLCGCELHRVNISSPNTASCASYSSPTSSTGCWHAHRRAAANLSVRTHGRRCGGIKIAPDLNARKSARWRPRSSGTV